MDSDKFGEREPKSCFKSMKAKSSQKKLVSKVANDLERFRPSFHFIGPSGWMNDPCAPGYDPNAGLHHLFYQWNPSTPEWTNDISWGHATSSDGVRWTHDKIPALQPSAEYDALGIFTGCFVPSGEKGEKDEISVVYTAVSHMPLHWSLPYHPGTEKIAIATSKDQGKTWVRSSSNPIRTGPPPGTDITGWRDPVISNWPAIDKILNVKPGEEQYYALVAGGIRDVTPAAFLYSVDPADLSQWKYIGSLISKEFSTTPLGGESKWVGHRGKNWECAGFFSLPTSDPKRDEHEFVIFGTEGGLRDQAGPKGTPQRTPRWPIWLGGGFELENGEGSSPTFVPRQEGILDWGCWYAAQSVLDPVSKTRVLWGWITEEDLPSTRVFQQTWSGMLSLPRELFVQTTSHVVGTLATPLDRLPSFKVTSAPSGNSTVETLGVRPLAGLKSLRKEKNKIEMSLIKVSGAEEAASVARDVGLSWEFMTNIDFDEQVEEVGIIIQHAEDISEHTRLVFKPNEETLILDRSHSTLSRDINTSSEVAPHTLLTTQPASTEAPTREPLALQIFFDNSVLEVFANERTVISSRVYPENEEGWVGISVFVGGSGMAKFKDLRVWTMEGGVNGVKSMAGI
ncbi:Arabinanase/levansucrase/invertase [Meredithblackwellia eburnea MCA 4105]